MLTDANTQTYTPMECEWADDIPCQDNATYTIKHLGNIQDPNFEWAYCEAHCKALSTILSNAGIAHVVAEINE